MSNNLKGILGILFGFTAVGSVIVYIYKKNGTKETQSSVIKQPIQALSGEYFGGKTKKNKRKK